MWPEPQSERTKTSDFVLHSRETRAQRGCEKDSAMVELQKNTPRLKSLSPWSCQHSPSGPVEYLRWFHSESDQSRDHLMKIWECVVEGGDVGTGPVWWRSGFNAQEVEFFKNKQTHRHVTITPSFYNTDNRRRKVLYPLVVKALVDFFVIFVGKNISLITNCGKV